MFSLIKKIHRQYKRLRHARDAYPRLRALGPTIETLCGGPVSFIPTEGGGHDYIFYVVREKRRIAVMRLANSRFVPQDSPVETRLNGPRMRLTPQERVVREHRICSLGGPAGLTPKPLWLSHTHDALLNSYVEGERLLTHVQKNRIPMWDAIDLAAERVVLFHAVVGEAHMDLSLMNVLADASLENLTLIDFELAPSPNLSLAEARLGDFLNLVEMAYKFMTPDDKQAATQRLERLFSQTLPADLRQTPFTRFMPKLSRITSDPVFRTVLFNRLHA
jgi:hypothetical protein